jgi:hypothetical protein
MTVTIENLAAVGNVVDEGYHHVTKVIVPAPALVLRDAYLKWYDLHRPDQRVRPDVDAEARAFLSAEAAAGRLAISGDLGFVIDHLSGEHVHLLLVFTWRGNNEMWESVYYKDVRDGGPFRLAPQGTHRAAICVWEFGAVAHEHLAWTRYLRSGRDARAKQEYVESQYAGEI